MKNLFIVLLLGLSHLSFCMNSDRSLPELIRMLGELRAAINNGQNHSQNEICEGLPAHIRAEAAMDNDLDILTQTVTQQNVNAVDCRGRLLLSLAATARGNLANQANVLHFLLDKGARSDLVTPATKYSPLFYTASVAIRHPEYLNALQILIERGANAFQEGQILNAPHLTPAVATFVVHKEYPAAKQALELFYPTISNLDQALQVMHLPSVIKFATFKSVKEKDSDGIPLLYRVVEPFIRGYDEALPVAQHLLSLDANPNELFKLHPVGLPTNLLMGLSCLMINEKNTNTDLFKLFMTFGANPRKEVMEGFSPYVNAQLLQDVNPAAKKIVECCDSFR